MRANLKVKMKRVTAVMLAMMLAFAGVSLLGSAGVARGAESEDNASEGDLIQAGMRKVWDPCIWRRNSDMNLIMSMLLMRLHRTSEHIKPRNT
jgi:hypothetical protein